MFDCETILEAVKKAGYEPGKDFKIAMDAASSEWKSEKGKGFYKLPKAGTEYTSEELIEHWAKLCDKYSIISIEDGLDEEDWEGWQKLTARLGDRVQRAIVTTNMPKPITEAYGVKLIEVLTGFKFIGEQIKFFEQTGSNNYVFGLEESYGCLAGTFEKRGCCVFN